MSDFNQQVIDESRANGGKVAVFGDKASAGDRVIPVFALDPR